MERNSLWEGRVSTSQSSLSVVDEYTRKYFRLEVDTSINGMRVTRVLSEIAQAEGPRLLLSTTVLSSSAMFWMHGHISKV